MWRRSLHRREKRGLADRDRVLAEREKTLARRQAGPKRESTSSPGPDVPRKSGRREVAGEPESSTERRRTILEKLRDYFITPP